MNINLPHTKQAILDELVEELAAVEHMAAIVLGGSHCLGLASEQSDLDLGLYYHETTPFAIEAIKRVVRTYNLDKPSTVTNFYEWGAWVNGRAWLLTSAGEVDLLYRNIDQVKATIETSKQGIWETDYGQQPPFGFSSVIYLAETAFCYPLYDPGQVIQELKQAVKSYPIKLKKTIIQQGLWSAEFALWQADNFAAKDDLYNCGGCITRILKSLVDVLFALNETYALGDKRSLELIAQMPKCPPRLTDQLEAILELNRTGLWQNVVQLRALFEQVVCLADDMYHPYYVL